MKRLLIALVAAFALLGLSGCFPVFIPVHDYHHGGYYGHHHRY